MTQPQQASRSAIAAWCLYDWANSAYNTVITTFVFAVYFTRGVAGDAVAGTAAWSTAMALAGVAIAVLSPVLGAVADRAGRRKPWLAATTALTILTTAGLWWVRPDPAYVPLALWLVAVGTVAFYLGRVSGWGLGVGYFGGLACLVVALFGFVRAESPVAQWLGTAAQEPVRATAWLVAGWFALFAWPLFRWVPEAPAAPVPVMRAVREGLAEVAATLRHVRGMRDAARFLVASAFYRDGINTLTAFGGIYAAGTFGMAFEEIVMFAIALNVVAGLGSVGFAWIDDRIGAKPTILMAVGGLAVTGTVLLLIEDKAWFWWSAMGLGLCFGPAQAAGRSLMARLSPEGRVAEMFGLYSLTGKAAGFLGPAALGWATASFGSQRAGMASILVFFAVGFALMLTVRDPHRQNATVHR